MDLQHFLPIAVCHWPSLLRSHPIRSRRCDGRWTSIDKSPRRGQPRRHYALNVSAALRRRSVTECCRYSCCDGHGELTEGGGGTKRRSRLASRYGVMAVRPSSGVDGRDAASINRRAFRAVRQVPLCRIKLAGHAGIAWVGPGPNPREDSIYPANFNDSHVYRECGADHLG